MLWTVAEGVEEPVSRAWGLRGDGVGGRRGGGVVVVMVVSGEWLVVGEAVGGEHAGRKCRLWWRPW